jgi:hypothetical protein
LGISDYVDAVENNAGYRYVPEIIVGTDNHIGQVIDDSGTTLAEIYVSEV